MKKYIKVDWPDSQSILEYSKNVYNINDSQSIFIDENEYNIIKEYKKLDKYLKTLKDKDILYVEDKYKNNWIIVFKEYKNHKIHSYYSYYINGNEHINSQVGVFASLREIRLITIANDEHLKQIEDDKYLRLYLNKEKSFKDGDILTYMFYNKPTIYIYRKNGGYNTSYYVAYSSENEKFYNIPTGALAENRNDVRFATEEEKQKLFDVIKANGYKWNAEIKTLEKLIEPKFKVGDKVKRKDANYTYIVTIAKLDGDYYNYVNKDGQCGVIHVSTQDTWELVPIIPKFKVGDRITNGKVSITIGYIDDNYYYEVGRNIANRLFIKNQDDWRLDKFDITTLKPFESKVLVRNSVDCIWKPAIFGFRNEYNDNAFYIVGGSCWKQYIPYNGNEHLLGTTDDCSNYYKTWE